jgi:hypothetical protein
MMYPGFTTGSLIGDVGLGIAVTMALFFLMIFILDAHDRWRRERDKDGWYVVVVGPGYTYSRLIYGRSRRSLEPAEGNVVRNFHRHRVLDLRQRVLSIIVEVPT